jgi:hypothetical protein
MRFISGKAILVALLTCVSLGAQQMINPATNINWPKVSGSGAPSSGLCTTNYGQPYTDTTEPNYYICTPVGWFFIGGSSAGVRSLNSLVGDVSLVSGDGSMRITPDPDSSSVDLSTVYTGVFQNAITLPSDAQHVVIYPTTYSTVTDPGEQGGVSASITGKQPSIFAWQGTTNAEEWGVTGVSGFALPAGVSEGSVTAIYLIGTTSTSYSPGDSGSPFNTDTICTDGSNAYGFGPSGVTSRAFGGISGNVPWGPTASTVATVWTASNLGDVTCTATIGGGAPLLFGASGGLQVTKLAVVAYYTGTPVTQSSPSSLNWPLYTDGTALNISLPPNTGYDVGVDGTAYVASVAGYAAGGGYTALGHGTQFSILPANTNSITNPTLNINGTGNLLLKKFGATALALNDVVAGTDMNVLLIAPATGGSYWELQNPQTASGGGAVSSVSNSDGSLTISPTTGAVVASLNSGHSNTWTASQVFNASVTGTGSFTTSSASGMTANDGAGNVVGFTPSGVILSKSGYPTVHGQITGSKIVSWGAASPVITPDVRLKIGDLTIAGQAAASSTECLQIDTSGNVTKTGAICPTGGSGLTSLNGLTGPALSIVSTDGSVSVTPLTTTVDLSVTGGGGGSPNTDPSTTAIIVTSGSIPLGVGPSPADTTTTYCQADGYTSDDSWATVKSMLPIVTSVSVSSGVATATFSDAAAWSPIVGNILTGRGFTGTLTSLNNSEFIVTGVGTGTYSFATTLADNTYTDTGTTPCARNVVSYLARNSMMLGHGNIVNASVAGGTIANIDSNFTALIGSQPATTTALTAGSPVRIVNWVDSNSQSTADYANYASVYTKAHALGDNVTVYLVATPSTSDSDNGGAAWGAIQKYLIENGPGVYFDAYLDERALSFVAGSPWHTGGTQHFSYAGAQVGGADLATLISTGAAKQVIRPNNSGFLGIPSLVDTNKFTGDFNTFHKVIAGEYGDTYGVELLGYNNIGIVTTSRGGWHLGFRTTSDGDAVNSTVTPGGYGIGWTDNVAFSAPNTCMMRIGANMAALGNCSSTTDASGTWSYASWLSPITTAPTVGTACTVAGQRQFDSAGSDVYCDAATMLWTAFTSRILVFQLTTTAAATSDTITAQGVTASSHCAGLGPRDAVAAANVATSYISALGSNSITVTHVTTATSMVYDIMCSAN